MTDPDRDWATQMITLFGTGDDMIFTVLRGEPWSKARPRFDRAGHVYQDPQDRDAERSTGWRLRSVARQNIFGNILLACRFYRSTLRRIDGDNLLKHICDAGNGVLWKDDSQITMKIAEVLHDPAYPRTVIAVGRHLSTMKRLTR